MDVRVRSNKSPWLSGMEVGHVYTVPLATYEGRIILSEVNDTVKEQIGTEFASLNLTGSQLNIESLSCQMGNIFGTLTAIDRVGPDLYKNVDIKGEHNIFKAGINYFK